MWRVRWVKCVPVFCENSSPPFEDSSLQSNTGTLSLRTLSFHIEMDSMAAVCLARSDVRNTCDLRDCRCAFIFSAVLRSASQRVFLELGTRGGGGHYKNAKQARIWIDVVGRWSVPARNSAVRCVICGDDFHSWNPILSPGFRTEIGPPPFAPCWCRFIKWQH